MKRMTNYWSPLAAAAGAMLSLSAWAGAAVTDGVLVVDVQSGSKNIDDPGASFSKIRKIGNGTAVLTGESFKSFLADITIEAGTLGATTLEYFGQGTGKTISVWEGATLDLSSTSGEKFNFSKYTLDIAGTVRRGEANADAGTLGNFLLSGDATFDTPKNLVGVGNGKDQALNGHTLTKTGTAMWTLSGGFLSNGKVHVTAGSMRLKSSSTGSQQAGFVKGDDGGLLEVSGGSTLELSPISYERPSTADLTFSGATENTLTCNYTPPASDTHEKFNLWTGSLTIDSPLLAILKNDMTFAGAVTVNGSLRTDSAAASLSTASLIFTGAGAKTFNAPLALGSGRVVFRDTDGVTFGNTVTNSAIGDSAIVFENAGVVDTGTAECPFDGVRSDATTQGRGKIPRVVVKGQTVLTSTKAVFGSSGGAAVFEIADGAVVSNGCRVGETSGEIVLVSVKTNSVWAIGASNGTGLNPQNRNGFGWTSYGDVELDGGKVIVNGGKSALSFGQGNQGEGVLAMSGGEWVSAALNLGNKGYGLWYQTGGTAIISNKVHVGEADRPDNTTRGYFTLSGKGTRASIPYPPNQASSSGFIGCCAASAVQSVVNLNDGATLDARRFWKDPASAGSAARFYVNFNGGVFAPYGPWQIFGNGAANDKGTPCNPPDRVTVYPGGAGFDITGALNSGGVPNRVDVPVPLLAPTGKGIASITLPDSVKELAYAHRPRIYIEGDGQGATAVAEIDSATCRLTGVTVTSPGWDYTEANTRVYVSTNVYITPGNRFEKSIACGVTLADNSSEGGLTVQGVSNSADNVFVLYCTNTYRGVTCCRGGGIAFAIPEAYPGGGLDVWKGAFIKFYADAQIGYLAGGGTVTGGNVSGVTNLIVRAEDFFADEATPLTIESKTLALADDVKVSVTGIGEYARNHGYATVAELAEAKLSARRQLVTAASMTGGANLSVVFEGLNEQEAAIFGVRKSAKGLFLRRTNKGLMVIVR